MNQLFVAVLNNALTASWIIVIVILFRSLFKNVPKWIFCLLWGFIGLMLVLPCDIESAFSLLPSSKIIETTENTAQPIIVTTGIHSIDMQVNESIENPQALAGNIPKHPAFHWIDLFCYIWLVGTIIFLVYAIGSYIFLRKRVSASVTILKNVRVCDSIATPFILGVIKPQIYLPSGLSQKDEECVLEHERTHLKRGDHVWKPIGYFILALYWFHPLCWIAYLLFCKDIELACDEKTIKEKDKEWRADYCQALLNCSTKRKVLTITPVAFGEIGIKERIKHVFKYKKTTLGITIVAVFMCVVLVVCFGTSPKDRNNTKESMNSVQSKVQEILFSTEPIPDTVFKGNINTLRGQFTEYYSKYGAEASSIPGVQYDLEFSSMEEAIAYLGYERVLEPYSKETQAVKVCVSGTKNGNFNGIYIQSECNIQAHNVNLLKIIPTNHSCELSGTDSHSGKVDYFSHQVSLLSGEHITGKSVVKIYGTDPLQWDNEVFTSAAGTEVQLLTLKEHGNVIIEAYFSLGNVIYVAGVEVKESQKASGIELLKEIVQQYEIASHENEMSVSTETSEPIVSTTPIGNEENYIAEGYEYSASGHVVE